MDKPMVDIDRLDIGEYVENVVDTAELEILHPVTFRPTGIKIQLYSAESEQWRKAFNRVLKENGKYEKMRDGVPPEKNERDRVSLLVAVTAGWSGVTENGVELPFNEANARRIYEHRKLSFIRRQIDEFIANVENFTR